MHHALSVMDSTGLDLQTCQKYWGKVRFLGSKMW